MGSSDLFEKVGQRGGVIEMEAVRANAHTAATSQMIAQCTATATCGKAQRAVETLVIREVHTDTGRALIARAVRAHNGTRHSKQAGKQALTG